MDPAFEDEGHDGDQTVTIQEYLKDVEEQELVCLFLSPIQ
jgi:hypothetical protein